MGFDTFFFQFVRELINRLAVFSILIDDGWITGPELLSGNPGKGFIAHCHALQEVRLCIQ